MAELAIIPITNLKPGIALSVPIYDGNQNSLLLLNQGIRITQAFIDRLKSRGISHVAIDSSKIHAFNVEAGSTKSTLASKSSPRLDSAVSELHKHRPHLERLVRHEYADYDQAQLDQVRQMRAKHSKELNSVYETSRKAETILEQPIRSIAEESMEQLLADIDMFVRLALEVTSDEAMVDHSLRVSQLAMSVATLMGLKFDDVANLGIGCLVSRLRLSDESHIHLHRDEVLSNGGLLNFKKELRENMYFLAPQKNLHIVARQVATQIFEHWDGSGHPHGRTGVQISNLARIAMVVDCYITFNSPRFLETSGQTPYQVVEQILTMTRAGKFDPQVIPALLNTVCLYPLGSFVELNNQTYGQVIRVTPGNYDRPVVKTLCRVDGGRAEEPQYNLLTQSHIKVVRALNKVEAQKVTATSAENILSLDRPLKT